MKKLLVMLILCLSMIAAHAQSVSMSDLTNLATINTTDADYFLTSGKPFKQEYTQMINGLNVRHYVGTTPASKPESVVIGDGIKTSTSLVLHIVTYTSTNTKYIRELIGQAKSAELKKNFQGVDQYNSIYIFDNFLYTVHVYIKTDNSEGIIKVEQKYYVE